MVPAEAGMVIVGAGECGARAAFALRENGYAGPVTLVGAERHLPYERPPLSKEAIAGEAVLKAIVSEERLAEAGVAHLAAVEAQAIDREAQVLRLSDGTALPYRKLLLATGARPRALPQAEGRRHCLTLRSFDDALAIRAKLGPGARLAVVGGGFIGLELAASARRRGAAVTVIEAAPRILGRAVPEEIAAVIHRRHASEGVRILAGQAIASIADTGAGVAITLAGGETVAADFAVIGIGAEPNTELAQAAGLAVDNGIAVDAHLRSADPDIFAAGDCCSFPIAHYGGRRVRLEAWRNAQEQGALAARNMLGAGESHAAVPWFWSDQYEMSLQIAGLAEGAAATVRREMGEGAFILFHLDGEGRLIAASGVGPGNSVARDIRLAEMMIARQARPDPAALAAPGVKLKTLLAA